MISGYQRELLYLIDEEIQKAKEGLFRSIIYFEKLEEECFEDTIKEFKQISEKLSDTRGDLLDFMNEKDFPEIKSPKTKTKEAMEAVK